MAEYTLIGCKSTSLEGDDIYEKEWYRQGFIFKDEEAFLFHENKVCYVAESDYPYEDKTYTRKDLVRICKGDVALATVIFYLLDWQHPETAYDEIMAEED